MPVLLMTRGDAPSRDLLRRAIDARYGFQPPTLETLKVGFKGRARVIRGFYKGWAPVTVDFSVRFPFQAHAHFAGLLLMVTIAHKTIIFDGTTVYNSGQANPSAQENESARWQLWAFNALMLTPLNDIGVELRSVGGQSFDAVHLASGLTARVNVDDSSRVTSVTTLAHNWDIGQEQTYSVRPSIEQIGFGALILPKTLTLAWDDVPVFELTSTSGEINPTLPDQLFTLAK